MTINHTKDISASPRLTANHEVISRLQSRLKQLTKDGAFTGSVLIAQDGNILLSQGYGFADRVRKIPNTPQTRFHLGSMTKVFTALGILILQSQGKLSIQDPICKTIVNCPTAWKDITIHHLLTHTSGLSSQLSCHFYEEIELTTSGPVPPSEQAYYLGLTSDWSLDTQPGEQYAYNNFGYIVLAHIIEQVSGQSYIDYLNQFIFAPLNLRNTGYQDDSSRVANLYPDCDSTEAVQFGTPPIPEGSGHLYSSSEDLFLLDQSLHIDPWLPRVELDQVFVPFVRETEFPGFGYGYGWFVGEYQGRPVVAGAGGGPAFATLLIRYLQDHLTVIVLTNQGKIDHFAIWAVINNELFQEE